MRRARVVALALAAALALAGASPATAATVEDHAARVSRALSAVRDTPAEAMSAEAAAALAAEVTALLPAGESIELGDRRVVVDSTSVDGLTGRLLSATTPSQRSAARADLEAHLTSLDSALGVPADVVEHDPAVLAALLESQVVDTRVDLGEILRGYMDRVLLAFNDWWAGLAQGGPVGRVSQVVVIVAVGVLLAAAAWSVLRALRPRGAARGASAAAGPAASPVVPAAEGLPADALGHAEGLAAEGRLREAVRALYGGAARTLVESGLVPQTRTRTSAELLSDAARGAPEIRTPLRELTRAFEVAWYGHVEPGAEGWSAARDAYGRTLGVAGRSQAG